MNNRITFLMFATAISCLSLGCSHTNTSFLSHTSEANQDSLNSSVKDHPSPDLKWLLYSDPKADANLAIGKKDFKLLAIASRDASLPGLGGGTSELRKQCGYRLLANTNDTLKSENALNSHSNLYQYAATYNQLMAVACQKIH